MLYRVSMSKRRISPERRKLHELKNLAVLAFVLCSSIVHKFILRILKNFHISQWEIIQSHFYYVGRCKWWMNLGPKKYLLRHCTRLNVIFNASYHIYVTYYWYHQMPKNSKADLDATFEVFLNEFYVFYFMIICIALFTEALVVFFMN